MCGKGDVACALRETRGYAEDVESVLERIKLFGCWEGVGEEEGERENC